VADAAGGRAQSTATGERADRLLAYKNEISGFCAAIRVGRPLLCGPDRAVHSAMACIRADEAVHQKTRLTVAAATT
jgi:hypothetical protein